ncbi:hypothetical protein K443DRAFT_469950 [Laccaria amethystina LaAM-08-1]|uniref:Uncharacterized protein n=1 Tax=Laccaria amethystina LaAM-08-1 TaxID=1095629 RepID=A0A0C9XPW4_9AGAR|nr:hypothetical protein K443DRAFT_469950 [Laccaria amethystina LaAM-08-1]
MVARPFQGLRSWSEGAQWTPSFRFDLICLSSLFLGAYRCQLSGLSLVALKCPSPFPCFRCSAFRLFHDSHMRVRNPFGSYRVTPPGHTTY